MTTETANRKSAHAYEWDRYSYARWWANSVKRGRLESSVERSSCETTIDVLRSERVERAAKSLKCVVADLTSATGWRVPQAKQTAQPGSRWPASIPGADREQFGLFSGTMSPVR